METLRGFWILTLSLLFLLSPLARAQTEGPRFAPPRPPNLDSGQDIEEPSEEDMELGDGPSRPPPPPFTGAGQAPPPAADFRPQQQSNLKIEPGKMRFKVADGAFYEKGKPRGRTAQKIKKSRRGGTFNANPSSSN